MYNKTLVALPRAGLPYTLLREITQIYLSTLISITRFYSFIVEVIHEQVMYGYDEKNWYQSAGFQQL